MKRGVEVDLGLCQIVLNLDPAPLSQRGTAPSHQKIGHVCCSQTAGWIKIQLSAKVGLSPGHTVLDGDLAPPLSKGHSPKFSAHACCGQTAGWIKMPLGREVSLGPGHIVLDGAQLPLLKGAQPQIFGACLLWRNGWMNQDATS